MNLIDLKSQRSLTERVSPKLINGKRTHYLNDSKTWYSSAIQTEGYLKVHSDEKYSDQMIIPEIALITSGLVPELEKRMVGSAQLVDLGPGKGDKAKILLERLDFSSYHAIDISENMLRFVEKELEQFKLNKTFYRGDFTSEQDLDMLRLNLGPEQAMIYLGATYSNYGPEFLGMIRSLMRKDDLIYVSAQKAPSPGREGQTIDELIESYSNTTHSTNLIYAVKQLGFNKKIDLKVRFNERTNEVEHYFMVESVPNILGRKDIKIGDEVVVFTSRKPTPEQFESHVSTYFKGEVISNERYVGFIGEKI